MILTRVALDIHDKDAAEFSEMEGLVRQAASYILARILYVLIVLIGTVFLVVPGVIAALMFFYTGYIVVDKGTGPLEALKQSHAITDGAKWDLFLFSLALLVVNFIGAMVVIVGLLVSVPVSLMASVYVYRRLSPAAAEEAV